MFAVQHIAEKNLQTFVMDIKYSHKCRNKLYLLFNNCYLYRYISKVFSIDSTYLELPMSIHIQFRILKETSTKMYTPF